MKLPEVESIREELKSPRMNGHYDRWTSVLFSLLKIGNKDPSGKLARMSGIEAFILFSVMEYLHGRPQIDKSAKINHDRWWDLAILVRKDVEKFKKKMKKEGKEDMYNFDDARPSNPDELIIEVSSDEEKEEAIAEENSNKDE